MLASNPLATDNIDAALQATGAAGAAATVALPRFDVVDEEETEGGAGAAFDADELHEVTYVQLPWNLLMFTPAAVLPMHHRAPAAEGSSSQSASSCSSCSSSSYFRVAREEGFMPVGGQSSESPSVASPSTLKQLGKEVWRHEMRKALSGGESSAACDPDAPAAAAQARSLAEGPFEEDDVFLQSPAATREESAAARREHP